MSVWATLSVIDCSEHTEKKGKFDYLSWTWAWAMVKDLYPEAQYELLEDTVYQDGTVEVRVSVTIDNLSHTMWLPVLDFKNRAIVNPNSFDINAARMRCLVKCLAMFGLGHYIYAGESLPQESETVGGETPEMVQAAIGMNACLDNDDYHGAAQLYAEWTYEQCQMITRAPSKGGQLSTGNRAKVWSKDFRLALNDVKGITEEEVA